MSAQIYRLVAKTDVFVFTVGAPIVTQTGTNFPYTVTNAVSRGIFTQYENGNALSIFSNLSSIQLVNCRITIPNLPGIVISNGPGLPNEIRCLSVDNVGGVTLPFSLPALELDVDQPINAGLYSPATGNDFYLSLRAVGLNWLYLDTRNTLAAYNGIDVYLQIEIDVLSPFGLVG